MTRTAYSAGILLLRMTQVLTSLRCDRVQAVERGIGHETA
jgi:hypothetical protein